MALSIADANVAARHFDTLANRATGATTADSSSCQSADRGRGEGLSSPSRGRHTKDER